MTVKRLRKKLGEAARRIVTIQTVGYKFTDK
jgi:DNA-binding response OmpR family regulator